MNPVRIPAAGTGRLRSSATSLRGGSASATGARITTSRTAAGLCGVSGGESTTCEMEKLMAGDHAIEIQIGAVMPDGTVYAGISPDTGRAMYTTPGDAERTLDRKSTRLNSRHRS